MKITTIARQLNLRDSLRELTEKKLSKFDRYFGEETTAYVTFRTRREQKIVEITITYGGTLFRSEEEDEDFRTALDRAVETLEGQIRKNKTRLERRIREGAFLRTTEEVAIPEEKPELIRTKTFSLKPMTPEEAILQMNLLEHTFFVFTEAESGKTAVVYRRHDSGYGLILPE